MIATSISPDKYTTVEEMAKLKRSNRLVAFFVLHFAKLAGDVTKKTAYIDSEMNAHLDYNNSKNSIKKSIYLINE